MEVSCKLHAAATLLPMKDIPVLIGGPQSPYGRYGDEKFLETGGNRSPKANPLAHHPINLGIPTPLYRRKDECIQNENCTFL
jgi:hypothetical protein